MDRAFGELLAWFCIDRKKAPIDEFFGDLQNFLKDFDVSLARLECLLQLRSNIQTEVCMDIVKDNAIRTYTVEPLYNEPSE